MPTFGTWVRFTYRLRREKRRTPIGYTYRWVDTPLPHPQTGLYIGERTVEDVDRGVDGEKTVVYYHRVALVVTNEYAPVTRVPFDCITLEEED